MRPKSPSYPWAAADAYPEVAESIAALQRRWTTAILSNADDDYLLPQLKRIGLTFPVVLSSEMIGAYKPHPLPFHRVLEELNLEPPEAVYVGDNPFDDVLGAKGVGMNAVWINRNGKTLDEGTTPARLPDNQLGGASLNSWTTGTRSNNNACIPLPRRGGSRTARVVPNSILGTTKQPSRVLVDAGTHPPLPFPPLPRRGDPCGRPLFLYLLEESRSLPSTPIP